MSQEAIEIIRGEHRSLAAVLDSADFLLDHLRAGRAAPDFKLLHAIMRYIEEFPDRLHHPKEDKCLFARVKMRTRDADELIDQLEREHRGGELRMAELKQALMEFERGRPNAAEAFLQRLDTYAQFNRKHMMTEERELIPLAEKHLVSEDWNEIGLAFRENRDPMFATGGADEFRQLFHTIVNLMPSPLGLGRP